jgi:hypothetical protein
MVDERGKRAQLTDTIGNLVKGSPMCPTLVTIPRVSTRSYARSNELARHLRLSVHVANCPTIVNTRMFTLGTAIAAVEARTATVGVIVEAA